MTDLTQDPRDKLPQPIQPMALDARGVMRFKPNKVVEYLLEHGGLDLNDLAIASADMPKADWEQFHQLIGYSVSGIPDLSLDTRRAVDLMEAGVTDWRDARIKALEQQLTEVRDSVRNLAVQVFDVHPEDLND
jgi:hypothetical protein